VCRYQCVTFRIQSGQYLFRKGTFVIPPSIYTSYEANFPLHESHEMAPRPFMTSEIHSILIADVVDCNPDIEVIRYTIC
jgi:hypothetical protein